jgi:hypothetical protein
MIVGEGGVQPQYFLRHMQWWEVQRYINGMRLRARPQWESQRWLGWVVSRIMGSKMDEPREMMTFPWEVEKRDPEADAEAVKALLEQCRQDNLKKDAK